MTHFCCIPKKQGLVFILCLVEVLYLLDKQRQQKIFMSSLLTSRQKNV